MLTLYDDVLSPDASKVQTWRVQPAPPTEVDSTSQSRSYIQRPAVAPREQELRTGLEGFGTRHEEREGIGQPIDRIEREADRKRVLNLLARHTGSQHRAHVVRTHRMLAGQLAEHAQRRP
jgi:hypothetical protein